MHIYLHTFMFIYRRGTSPTTSQTGLLTTPKSPGTYPTDNRHLQPHWHGWLIEGYYS